MKKKTISSHIARGLITGLVLLFMSFLVKAQPPIAVPDGFAGYAGTTGGGNASPVTVSSASAFKSAVSGNSAAVIYVNGFLNVGSVSIGSNKTIVGMSESSGIGGGKISVNGSNYIFQNLIIGPGGSDVMEVSGGSKVFITKCSFHDAGDEILSIVRGADYVTVSWCKFYFDNSHSHAFAHLIGNKDGATGDRGKLNTTMHHNWYAKGVVGRMPRVRFGQVHIYNNYYNSAGNDYCIGIGKECHIRLENTHFDNVNSTWDDYGGTSNGEIGWSNLLFEGSTQPTFMPNAYSNIFNPPYSYSLDPVANVESIVRNGAGNVMGGVGPVSVTGVAVAPTSAAVNIGGKAQLTATVSPSNATNKAVNWSSNNTSVATVNSSGLVTGVANGSATITVKTQDGGYTASCNVSVSDVVENNITIQENETGVISYDGSIDNNHSGFTGDGFINTDNASGNGITWEVCAAANGTYTLQWRFANGASANRVAQVEVNDAVAVSDVGFPSTGAWASWDNTASVGVNLIAGTNKIRLEATQSSGLANIDNMSVTGNSPVAGGCTINIHVESVSVSPTQTSVNKNATVQLKETLYPANASNKNVKWSSSNVSLAKVNQHGVVTGVAEGTVEITVTTEDGGFKSTSTITVVQLLDMPPTVSITSPSNGASFSEPANITISAEASDADGTVAKVEFYNGTTKIGETRNPGIGTAALPKHWHECKGFGTGTKGGIAGEVYKVTNLNSSGSGSFKDAVSKGNRLIVFEVGGVIEGSYRIPGNTTVAGQTAPYPGITLIKGNLRTSGNNIVVSHITTMLGDQTSGNQDAANINGNSNVVFDHVTVLWSKDEVLSMSSPDDVTLYKCIIAEGLQYAGHGDGEHSKGSLITSPDRLSLIGCLYAHNAMRNPRVYRGEIFIANQVNYNWATGWDEPSPNWFDFVVHVVSTNVTFIGNVGIQGPESVGEYYLDGHVNHDGDAYMEDNIIIDRAGNDLYVYDPKNITPLSSPPLWPSGFAAIPAHESLYENLRTVGPRPGDRDAHNSRIVRNVANGDGEVIDSQDEVGGYPNYPETRRTLTVPNGAEARQAWLDALEDEIAVDKGIDLSRLYSMVGSQASDKLLSGGTGYSFTWNGVAAGTYRLTAIATDNSGNRTTSSPVTITVVDNGNVPVTGVTVSPTTASVGAGKTTQLIATVSPSNATNKAVSWSSGNTSVATVDQSGIVTGISQGSAFITVKTQEGGYTASCQITVSDGSSYCNNPVAISIPFVKEGAGDFCWSTTKKIAYINSWNLEELTINGVDFTNTWSDQFPPAQNGQWVIHYVGKYDWSHFEAAATKNAVPMASGMEKSIMIYPNPFKDGFNIDLSRSAGAKRIEVINSMGQVVKALNEGQVQRDLIKLNIGTGPGLYLIRIYNGKNIVSEVIVKE